MSEAPLYMSVRELGTEEAVDTAPIPTRKDVHAPVGDLCRRIGSDRAGGARLARGRVQCEKRVSGHYVVVTNPQSGIKSPLSDP